jgi:hypothetical protein
MDTKTKKPDEISWTATIDGHEHRGSQYAIVGRNISPKK